MVKGTPNEFIRTVLTTTSPVSSIHFEEDRSKVTVILNEITVVSL